MKKSELLLPPRVGINGDYVQDVDRTGKETALPPQAYQGGLSIDKLREGMVDMYGAKGLVPDKNRRRR